MALMSFHSNSLHGQKTGNARLWRRHSRRKSNINVSWPYGWCISLTRSSKYVWILSSNLSWCMGSSWLTGIQLCVKNFFYVRSSHFPYFLFFSSIHRLSWHAPALGVLLAFAFISVAQEKIVKQGQLGRERNADNILRDLKEIFTPSWELASPTEGNAVQLEQAVCLIIVSLLLSWALQNTN